MAPFLLLTKKLGRRALEFRTAEEPGRPLDGEPQTNWLWIPEGVAIHAAVRPNATAIKAGQNTVTYAQLHAQSSRLAQRLLAIGVHKDVPVALCLPRSPITITAALGIIKAGVPFLPMDPDDPPDRIALILEDAGAPLVITNSAVARQMRFSPDKTLLIDSADFKTEAETAIPVDNQPDDLAYIIYTSGSTGRPKGVEITRRGLMNLIAWHQSAFSVTPQDRASHVAGLSFDAAIWEVWPYLSAGASLHLVDNHTRLSPELLRDWLIEQEITISFVPTPIAERMLLLEWPRKTALRLLLTGGDRLRRYPSPSLPFHVINNYGPTECAVVATSAEVTPEDPARPNCRLPSIGAPIANTRIYLIDPERPGLSPSDQGEITIAGPGVARGYRNLAALTAEKFVPDPFHRPGDHIYRTGDLGRLLPNGEIEFIGRMDDQIKIRGYRIEPGEVIANLGRHPDIRESVVTTVSDQSGESQLAAYIVLEENATVTSAELRQFLRSSLPEYMIPSVFVRLEELSLTTHGKIDHSRLPSPEHANILPEEMRTERVSTATERRIEDIACHLLGCESIGPDENFFLLGGHSLLGAQLISRLRAAFGVDIPLRTLFGAPTAAQLALEIETLSGCQVVASGQIA